MKKQRQSDLKTRLSLHRETLRRLQDSGLRYGIGGLARTDSCYDDCCSEVGSNCVTEEGAVHHFAPR